MNTISCSLANRASEGPAESTMPTATTMVPSRCPTVAARRMPAAARSVSMLLRAAHTTSAQDTTSNSVVPRPHSICSAPGSAHASGRASSTPTAVHRSAP